MKENERRNEMFGWKREFTADWISRRVLFSGVL
jgi:hypothetical protein